MSLNSVAAASATSIGARIFTVPPAVGSELSGSIVG
jgi:hypothetical protein